MKHLGLVKWFSNEKGYGVIVTPENEEIFLHQKNLALIPPEKFIASPLIFEINFDRGKNTAINAHPPSGYSDFKTIMSYLERPHIVVINERTTGTSRHGNTFTRQEENKYNVIDISLPQIFINKDPYEAISFFEQCFNENEQIKDNEEFLQFLKLFRETLKDLGGNELEEKVEQSIHYFFNNLSKKILYEVWRTDTHSRKKLERTASRELRWVEKIQSNSTFAFPEDIFYEKDIKIGISELRRIAHLNNGSIIIKNRLLSQINELIFITQLELKQLCDFIKVPKDTETRDSLKDVLSERVIQILTDPILGDIEKLSQEFKIVLETFNSQFDSVFVKSFIQSFNNYADKDLVFYLWQKNRHFEPSVEFLEIYYNKLTHDDFIKGGDEFHKGHIEKIVRSIGNIDSINAFGQFIFLMVESPIKLPYQYIESLPKGFQFSIWLNFPRRDSYENYYEAKYHTTDFILDYNIISDYILSEENLSGIIKNWQLINSIQNLYNLKTHYSKVEGFRNLTTKVKEEFIITELSKREININDFLSDLLSKIDDENGVLIFRAIWPKLIQEYQTGLEKLIELVRIANINQTTMNLIFEYIAESQPRDKRVSMWFNGKIKSIEIYDVIEEFENYPDEIQADLFRKAFTLLKSNDDRISKKFIDAFRILLSKSNINRDVRICLEAIYYLIERQSLFGENEISEIICKSVNEELAEIVQIKQLFEYCKGRTWMSLGENQKEWFVNVEGKKYSVNQNYISIGERQYWLDKENRQVEVEGTNYNFTWSSPIENSIFSKLYDRPAGITFCDAVESGLDEKVQRNFSWCCNAKCYSPCQNDHNQLEWRQYSLRDFIKLLNLPFDSDKYYRLVSVINRANRILKKLQCHSCSRLLRDVRTSEFAFYRVTVFHCTNSACVEHHKVIYLTHCLNWKCKNIIDSRISQSCPNGWYICDACNSCCSQEKINNRYNNLIENNAFDTHNSRHRKLKEQVDYELGHFEKNEKFNYQTGEKIVEAAGG